MFQIPSAAALNHLLLQNDWSLPRLARFSGQTARFDIFPFSFTYTILANGTLLEAEATARVDAICSISPSLLPRIALNDENAQSEIRTEGDAALLAEIFFLSRNLRWNAAEDLSRYTGDIAAERIIQTTLGLHRQLRDGVTNFSQATAEYWTEENPLLAKPAQLQNFAQQVDTLRDDVARLEQRIGLISCSTVSGKTAINVIGNSSSEHTHIGS